MLTLKHSAFPRQLLMEEVDLGESTTGGSHDHAVFSMRATNGPTAQVPGAQTSPNIMHIACYEPQDLQQVRRAKAEGIKRPTCLDLLKRSLKTSIWSEEEHEEMSLPGPETSLVYPLHHVQQSGQDWEDEVPPETMGPMQKQEKRKSNHHAEENFAYKLESMNIAPRISKLIQKDQEVFGPLPPALSCRKLVRGRNTPCGKKYSKRLGSPTELPPKGDTCQHMWGDPLTQDTWTGWPRYCLSNHLRERVKGRQN